ncbi:MAG: DUF1501 domain-containing protein [Pirellulaceae bacterium]|nr:DUF1501 domain-containing protein [Pirellulaceae bacterium]
MNRRELVQIGGISALGVGMASLAAGRAWAEVQQVNYPKRPAKACIFLFMWGGPSQLETFDPKPDAPAEIRGEFQPISTCVPGIQISEHFSRLAQLTDRVSIIRSLTHDDPAHLSSGHATLTGQWAPVLKSDDTPPSAQDSPHLGALVSRIRSLESGNSESGLPGFVAMPWKAFHPAAPGGEAPGQHGGWLGSAFDGMLLTGDPNQADWQPRGLSLPAEMSLDRLGSRVELLKVLDAQRLQYASRHSSNFQLHRDSAMQLLSSDKVRNAFDLSQEASATRERYGRNIHGQCVLLARRLVEHGVPLVTVNWHNDGKNFWDTHGNNFNRLKNDLIPPADTALSALLVDLEERGMLDETIVAWVGEFGRRPQVSKANAGREHWPFCYSGLLAGGGIKRGFVHGSSDRHAAYPASSPVSPLDFAATILHALGIPSQQTLVARENRPHKITGGSVITELLA